MNKTQQIAQQREVKSEGSIYDDNQHEVSNLIDDMLRSESEEEVISKIDIGLHR